MKSLKNLLSYLGLCKSTQKPRPNSGLELSEARPIELIGTSEMLREICKRCSSVGVPFIFSLQDGPLMTLAISKNSEEFVDSVYEQAQIIFIKERLNGQEI